MEFQYIFYGISIFFLLVTIGYFIGTYLDDLPVGVKVFLSFLMSVILFLVGDYLRRLNK